MAQIIINERDNTVPTGGSQSTDIAYVPGFANTNWNCYILTVAGATPADPNGDGTLTDAIAPNGTVSGKPMPSREDYNAGGHLTTPQYVVNTFDSKAWYLSVGTGTSSSNEWLECTVYASPSPENEPTLCLSVADFEENFGKSAYKFSSADVGNDRTEFPTFETDAGSMSYKFEDFEKSYIYARELISSGLPVIYDNYAKRTNYKKDAIVVKDLYKNMADMFENISDLGEVSVKYITSGAYPVYELDDESITDDPLNAMCNCAVTRGDAVAIIDHTDNPGRALTGDNSVFASINSEDSVAFFSTAGENNGTYGEYSTLFTPWSISKTTTAGKQSMPGSFSYLLALARSIKNNSNILAISGVARGLVPQIVNLNTTSKLTNKIADSYQGKTGIAINPITQIQPYGLTIWGNRTLLNNVTGLTAHSFLNTRNMVNDIKKLCYNVAKSLMFEQNSEQLWIKFKAGIIPTLNQMQSSQGMSKYVISKGSTNEKAKLVANIAIYPIYAVEEIEINISLEDEEVTVE